MSKTRQTPTRKLEGAPQSSLIVRAPSVTAIMKKRAADQFASIKAGRGPIPFGQLPTKHSTYTSPAKSEVRSQASVYSISPSSQIGYSQSTHCQTVTTGVFVRGSPRISHSQMLTPSKNGEGTDRQAKTQKDAIKVVNNIVCSSLRSPSEVTCKAKYITAGRASTSSGQTSLSTIGKGVTMGRTQVGRLMYEKVTSSPTLSALASSRSKIPISSSKSLGTAANVSTNSHAPRGPRQLAEIPIVHKDTVKRSLDSAPHPKVYVKAVSVPFSEHTKFLSTRIAGNVKVKIRSMETFAATNRVSTDKSLASNYSHETLRVTYGGLRQQSGLNRLNHGAARPFVANVASISIAGYSR